MKLRLRGDAVLDIDWDERVPAITEMIWVEGQWYRVISVAWAVRSHQGARHVYDVALVVHKSTAPDGLTVEGR